MTERTYTLKIVADGTGVKAVLADIKKDAEGANAGLRALGQGGAEAGKGLNQAGLSAKQLEQAVRGVPAQLTDIFVSLQAGQAPLQVFLQQGGQLKDMFGGIGPAARAVGGQLLALVNPYTVAAGAVGVLTLAYIQGGKEATEFVRAIALSGNAAGTSVNELQAISVEVANTAEVTRGAASEALTILVATGKVAASSLDEVAVSALEMQKATGQSIEETARQFAALAKAPVEASLKLHESLKFLTPEILLQIRAMEEQGRTAEAAAIAQQAYAKAQTETAQEVIKSFGVIEETLKGAAALAKKFWDALLNVGREDELSLQLKKARDALEASPNDSNARLEVKVLEAAVEAERARTAEKARQKALNDAAVDFITRSDTAADRAANKSNETLAKLREGYLATLEQIRQASGGADPLNTKEGIAATERYRAKLQELGAELNKAAIAASDKRLRDLSSAFDEGEKRATELKNRIAELNAELAKVSGGQGTFAQKAQDRRDSTLTQEQSDAANRRRTQDLIDEAQRLSTFATNASIDGRAREAEDYAKRAAALIEQAGKAADKIKDNDLAANLFDQLDAAQKSSLEAQKTVAQSALQDVENNNALIGQRITELQTRLEALKAGATVEVKAETAAAQSQVDAMQQAVAALPSEKTITINVVRNDSGGAEGIPISDLPARAYGGQLPGWAPNERADNMLYKGTPGEWIIPIPEVRYYGNQFMRDLLRRRIPRYAYGGALGGVEFPSSGIASRIPTASLADSAASLSSGTPVMRGHDLVIDGSRYPVQMEVADGDALERVLSREALTFGRRRRLPRAG